MKLKIRTPYNYTGPQKEVNDRPSETVPDQSMSLQEILQRYSQGLPLTADGRIPVWHGEDNDLPDWNSLDLAEREELLHLARERRKEAEKAYADAMAAEKAAHQGPNVQRTTGDEDHQGTTDQPDNPISEKNRPAGEADTRSPKKDKGSQKH